MLNIDGNVTQTGALLIGGSISYASTLNVASSSNLSGNLIVGGFLTCGSRWATFSNNFSVVSGTTYCRFLSK